jgi:hypothetical protein
MGRHDAAVEICGKSMTLFGKKIYFLSYLFYGWLMGGSCGISVVISLTIVVNACPESRFLSINIAKCKKSRFPIPYS